LNNVQSVDAFFHPNIHPLQRKVAIMARRQKAEKIDAHRDPITDAPGAHPVGVGVGAGAGAAGGAAVGSVAGPLGTAVGAVVGGVAGGLAAINPTIEDEYWRAHYASRPYVSAGEDYETYAPAYRYGWESYVPGQRFEVLEPQLRRGWEKSEWSAELAWEKAKQAVRDAWHRIERALPGDADRDGR
jgi:hypothetical protein